MGNTKTKASLFELDGIPAFGQALPLALQHVVAMIVGCVTPAIMISSAAGVSGADKVILIQASLVICIRKQHPAFDLFHWKRQASIVLADAETTCVAFRIGLNLEI